MWVPALSSHMGVQGLKRVVFSGWFYPRSVLRPLVYTPDCGLVPPSGVSPITYPHGGRKPFARHQRQNLREKPDGWLFGKTV